VSGCLRQIRTANGFYPPRSAVSAIEKEMMTAILDAARAVMREEGVAAAETCMSCPSVGLRPPSLYEYFPGKMALYDAVSASVSASYAAGESV